MVICLCFFGCKVNLRDKSPKHTTYQTPVPAPAAPGEPFNPIPPKAGKKNIPQCAEWTRTAGPDESLIITGENFTRFGGESEGKDTRFTVYSAGGAVNDANILRSEKNKVVITIDKKARKWGMFMIWPANSAGYGEPITVNRTDAWWLGPAKADRGGRVSVYGRNLAQYNDTVSSNVYIKPQKSPGVWTKIVKVNPYKVDFIVPANLTDGDYEVWTHNGHGGDYGWSGPLKLTIRKDKQWKGIELNVKNYGAKGDGLTDDTHAIHQALAAAKKSEGSTVYFPEGIYLINKMLNVSDNTRWKGEGRDRTFITCGSNFFSSNAMIVAHARNFEIVDLTFDTNNNLKGSGPEFREEAINLDASSDVKLNRVTFACKGYSALRLDHANGVSITNSKIISNKSFLGGCSNLMIDSCDFYLTNDAEMALHLWNGKNVSMTNSTCRDLDNSNIHNGSGWGKGRFFHSAGNGGSTRHIYLENNRTYDLAVRPVGADQNSGEQFLWEGFSAKWSGSVVSSTASNTVLSQFSKSLEPKKAVAVIIKGRGLGQSRWITSSEGMTITLERPWNVPPDKTSTVAVGYFADRIVMYKNIIDGKAEAVLRKEESASTGIQPYGGVLNFIADRNILTEVRAGIANWSTQHTTGIDPNYFNLFTNNIISYCRWGILNGLLELKRPGTGLLATTYRGNTINKAIESGVAVWLSKASTPLMENFLYEHNQFLDVPRGFYFRTKPGNSIASQTFYKNLFRSSAGFPAIELSPRVKLRGNTYSGFVIPYTGTSSQNAIEAPFHVVEIGSTINGNISSVPFTIWNTGTPKLDLRFKTDASWLRVSGAKGTIDNERSGTVILKANPAGLSAGKYKANLSVISGNQVRKYTILFNVRKPVDQKVVLKEAGL